jgi:rhodanese-related sulfurtransferase
MPDRSAAAAAPATDLSLEEAGALAPLVSPEEAAARVGAGAVLIDVRSEAGRAANGGYAGAVEVDRNDLDSLFDEDSATRLAEVTSPDTPIVVACGSVRGSGPVAAVLREKGFTNVVQLAGGFDAWREAGQPITPR